VEIVEARHDDPAPGVLGVSWSQASADHAAFVAAAEARVIEWFWGPAYAGWERFEPYWSQRDGQEPKTRRRRTEPEDKSHWQQLGADETGAIVVSRRWGYVFEPEVVQHETLCPHDNTTMLSYRTTGRGSGRERKLVGLHAATRAANGRLERLDCWRRDGSNGFHWIGETYAYDDGRLIELRKSHRKTLSAGWEHRRHQGRQTAQLELTHSGPVCFQHDADGLLAITTGTRTAYRRRPPGAVTRAAKLVRDQLPARIAAWAARNASTEDVYCLGIGYVDFYNGPMPPSLGLGTVAELQAWREAHSTDLAEVVFNPAEFACHDIEPPELDSPELADAYQTLNQDWASRNDEAAPRRLFNAIAKALAARDWSHLPIGEKGFAVVSVNMELGDFERDIRATVPVKLRRTLLGAA
jgi:hypothetical protein